MLVTGQLAGTPGEEPASWAGQSHQAIPEIKETGKTESQEPDS